jgi:hypothetical protein
MGGLAEPGADAAAPAKSRRRKIGAIPVESILTGETEVVKAGVNCPGPVPPAARTFHMKSSEKFARAIKQS